MAGIRVREAVERDGLAIASIHVRSWQAAYRGQLPDEYLDNLSVDERLARLRASIASPPPEWRMWVAVDGPGRVVGFACTGRSEDADATPETGEVLAIYLEPEAFGKGVGRELFARAVEDLGERGFRTATLWVLETNDQARRFYEAAGWRHDGAVATERIDCSNLPTVRYRVDLA